MMLKTIWASDRRLRILGALAGLYLLYRIGASAMGWYTAEKLTGQMQSACVGRFLIDLPAGMDYSYGRMFISGLWAAAIPETEDAFAQRVSAREAQINAQPNELGQPNMEQVEPVSGNGFTGKIFRFGRTSVRGLEYRKTVYYVNVALEGYAHAAGTTFVFTTDSIDPGKTHRLTRLIDQLRVVAPNEIPTAPGFCFGRGGMLVDPLPVEWTEGAGLFAGFRDHPDLALAFNTRAGLGKYPSDPGRLGRVARSDAEMPLWLRPLLKKIRIGERTINGIAGEEVLHRMIEFNAVHVYAFDWEVTGTKHDAFVPDMHLEMSTGHRVNAGGRPVPSFLSEEALVRLWDKISDSIRVRPTTPVVAAGS